MERASPVAAERQGLHFKDMRPPDATVTLVFVHGACSTGCDWDPVVSNLRDSYHIILPDLPHHGGSAGIQPFTIDGSVSLLGDLILRHAIDGKAHVIGLSLGAHVAVHLASRYPGLARTVFVSGYETCRTISPETMARGLWLQSRIECVIPKSWIRWAMDGVEFPVNAKPSMQLCREIAAPHGLFKQSRADIVPWSARTMVVAAGKRDWLPTADRPEDALELRVLLSEVQGHRTRAVVHPELRHPWHRQRPGFFAKALRAWIEEEQVLDGFVAL